MNAWFIILIVEIIEIFLFWALPVDNVLFSLEFYIKSLSPDQNYLELIEIYSDLLPISYSNI